MRRIIVDRATIALLDNLSEPLEFCDESGWVLGTFIPEAGELVEVTASVERLHHQEVEAAGLTHHFSLGFLGFSWKIQDIHMMLRKQQYAVLVTILSESRKTVRQKSGFARDTKLPI